MSYSFSYPEIVTAHLTVGEASAMLEHAIAALDWERRHQSILRAEPTGSFDAERRTMAARNLVFARRKIAALRVHLAACTAEAAQGSAR